ncbi:(2Fe-2S)-binding protein [Paraburkholderia fungorum]|uniref:(2Fe-2S)-binding protein n=1 Tax=Paraburkholderia fungorum TaxID=134537 RepID=UPI0038BDC876
MFELLPLSTAETVSVDIDGNDSQVPAHFTVAEALLAGGNITCRTSQVSGEPRGPFCMMGVCFECLVEIDGVPNQQACMTAVRPGMRVRSMRGKARLA